jgi:exopolysaccharide production protein ExoZ
MPTDRQPVLALQIMRAVAATMIVVHHGLYDLEVVQRLSPGSLQNLLPLSAGVDLFFLISGFVMVISTDASQGRTDAVLPFLRRRLARIWPIYAAVTLFFAALILAGLQSGADKISIVALVQSLTFWPYAHHGSAMQPIYGLGWTLNYEMFFYLLFALALPLPKAVARVAVIAVLLALVLLGQKYAVYGTAFWFWSQPIILEFAIGMLIAVVWLRWGAPLPLVGIILICAGAALFLALVTLAPPEERLWKYGLPMALVLAGGLAFMGGSGPVSRFMGRLGDASYALYLLHPFVQKGVLLVFGATLIDLSPWLHLIVTTGLAMLVSILVWQWFERPLTKALQGRALPRSEVSPKNP